MPPKKQQHEPEQADGAELPVIDAPEAETAPEAEIEPEAEPDDNPLRTVAIEAMVGAGLDRDTATLAYAAAQEAVMAYVGDHPEAVDSSDIVIPASTGEICRECFPDGWATPTIGNDWAGVGCSHGSWSRN